MQLHLSSFVHSLLLNIITGHEQSDSWREGGAGGGGGGGGLEHDACLGPN